MEIIELTKDNITQYLDDCVTLQKYLVSDVSTINPAYMTQTAQCSHSYFIGVLEDEHIVGLAVMSKVVHPVNITGYINNIVVHPDMRGKGLFSQIMTHIEEKAKQWNCTEIAFTCSRPEVQRMYEKRGYIQKDTHFYTQKI